MTAIWEPFPLPSSAKHPVLFIQRLFTKESYTVYMTDLCHIWRESLTKSGILDRADDQGASIDPSHNDSQLAILLEKLGAGLLATNDQVDVELDLKQQGESCILHITTKEILPKPLDPLIWKFRLKPTSSFTLTTQLVVPLMSASASRTQEIEYLISVIQDKDVVIKRFVEHFEDSHMDLSIIFPGYRKGKPMTGKSKGVTHFNENSWQKDIPARENHDDVETLTYMMARAYELVDMTGYNGDRIINNHISAVENSWWKTWNGKVKVKANEVVKESKKSGLSTLQISDSMDEKNDFVVQDITTMIVPHEDKQTGEEGGILDEMDVDEEDETTDDDLEGVSLMKAKRKGGARPANELASTTAEKRSPSMRKSEEADIETKQTSDSESRAAHKVPFKNNVIKSTIKKTIGSKASSASKAEQPPQGEDPTEKQVPAKDIPEPKKRLPSPTPENHGDELDSADQKRRELAKAVEAKKKAPPKKARRF